MKENLTTIELQGKEYPIKFDNYVLSKVQEEYGNIEKFENDIIWFEEKRDGRGKRVTIKDEKTGEERMVYIDKEPSIKAINFIVPLLIEEGLQIYAEEIGKELEIPSAKEIVRSIDIPFLTLAKIIHEEFRKCFASKKYNPRKTQEK